MYCAPTSVANSILWFAANGYPQLVEDPEDEQTQRQVVLDLAGLMGTNEKIGTSPVQIASGLAKFLEQSGVESFTISYAGWRPGPEVQTAPQPTLKWLSRRNEGLGAVWLNFGYYKRKGDDYVRSGGHWVTLIAVGEDENGNPSPNTLVVHDPAPSAGPAGESSYITVARIKEGQLVGTIKGLPQPAAGYFRATSGLLHGKTSHLAILDCALAVRLEVP